MGRPIGAIILERQKAAHVTQTNNERIDRVNDLLEEIRTKADEVFDIISMYPDVAADPDIQELNFDYSTGDSVSIKWVHSNA